ncbi:MAG: hypothetical protein Q8R92_05050, partial [Deltaproteobacteria bacterium]|nr:hypothetical protein [Deltaproteobacteria bacterium]
MNGVFDLEAWREILVSSFTEMGRTLAGFAPNVVGAIAILAVGWGVSKVLEIVSRRLLDRMGLNRTVERLGIAETLRGAGVGRKLSDLIALVLFWFLMLIFVLSAFETLHLTAVTGTIDRLIAYLPKLVATALIVIIGLLFARFVGNVTSSAAAAAQFAFPRQLGSAARVISIFIVGILGAEQLGIDTQILVTGVTALLAAFGLGVSLAFALGSREVVRAILAGHYLRQSLAEGERYEVEGRGGVLE